MGFLNFRIPGHQPIKLEGDFKELDFLQKAIGFVLSDFNQSKYYQFKEGLVQVANSSIKIPYCSSEDEYLDQAKKYISALANQGKAKAILSRVKQVRVERNNNWFEQLCARYPNAFVYHFHSSLLGEWIGATPEVLLDVEGGKGHTVSLAGTKVSMDESPWGTKELEEQGIVTNYIESILQKHCSDVSVENQTELFAGPVKHLLNKFQFQISTSKVGELVKDLHPTPAVLGFPVEFANELIQSIEIHKREFYAGFLGIINSEESKLFVNLRCAQLIENNAYLYLGGGLTKDSNPESEWQETENKAKTLLDILQNN